MKPATASPAAAREVIALRHMKESDFCTDVVNLAKLHGFMVHHDLPARTNRGGWHTALQGDAGFPDILALGYGRLIVAELKVGYNQPTEMQSAWLWRFGQLSEDKWHMEAHVWKPSDWDEIEKCFKRKGRKG